ncbi:uncharacterized protein LOC128962319 [Oppia nitens]|uniref:uncharacterized protein LOC128962319 n=1 Tax=Oppia nitens TaxID=1686743 RepID=UPI0023DAD98D|nr:uncharacterized protein LOC128962319 [Oppia nitens]
MSALIGLTIGTVWKGGGQSNSFRKQDDHGNYAFGYDIKDPHGASNSRRESGDGHGNKAADASYSGSSHGGDGGKGGYGGGGGYNYQSGGGGPGGKW